MSDLNKFRNARGGGIWQNTQIVYADDLTPGAYNVYKAYNGERTDWYGIAIITEDNVGSNGLKSDGVVFEKGLKLLRKKGSFYLPGKEYMGNIYNYNEITTNFTEDDLLSVNNNTVVLERKDYTRLDYKPKVVAGKKYNRQRKSKRVSKKTRKTRRQKKH